MTSQMSLVVAVFLLGCIGLSHQDGDSERDWDHARLCWTHWFNGDHPSDLGDWETLRKLREKYPHEICHNPRKIQAVTANKEIPAEDTKQIFYAYDTETGFICRNEDQKFGHCLDYKVRFKCPCHY